MCSVSTLSPFLRTNKVIHTMTLILPTECERVTLTPNQNSYYNFCIHESKILIYSHQLDECLQQVSELYLLCYLYCLCATNLLYYSRLDLDEFGPFVFSQLRKHPCYHNQQEDRYLWS